MTTYQKGHEPAGAPVTWEPSARYDAEIARLSKERDEANKVRDDALDARDRWRDFATKRTDDLSAITADRDALKAALDEEIKAGDIAAAWIAAAEVRSNNADKWLSAHNSRRAASRAKE